MSLQINRNSQQPIYQQIAEQIRQQIRDGQLPVKSRLPTIRQVAHKLGITRLTVQNAYEELRADGWIESTVGRGTFVAGTAQPHEQLQHIGQSATAQGVLEDLPKIGEIPVVLSFAYAEPDVETFPMDHFWATMTSLRPFPAEWMNYRSAQGEAELRVELSRLLQDRDVEASPGQLMVTSGATQAASLVVRALTNPGDCVLVEQPTHMVLLHLLESYHLRPVGVPIDSGGPDLEQLERAIRQYRPRFLYTIPNFQNPTGLSIPLACRQALIDLATRYDFWIVEDDVYGLLAYDDLPLPALKALDRSDRMIYISSFTKILMPGIRVGYIHAPQPLVKRLLILKRTDDLCSPAFIQQALAEYLHTGSLKSHLRHVLPIYKQRRDTLVRELALHMPKGISWIAPQGGFSCWLTLPCESDTAEIYRRALKNGVAVTPGDAFYIQSASLPHLRICFAAHKESSIREGINVLSEVLRQEI